MLKCYFRFLETRQFEEKWSNDHRGHKDICDDENALQIQTTTVGHYCIDLNEGSKALSGLSETVLESQDMTDKPENSQVS